MVARLTVTEFDEECDYADLPALVARAKTWLEAAKDGQDDIRKLYDEWVADMAAKDLYAKFEREFTPDQQALLLAKLKTVGAPAAKKARSRSPAVKTAS